MAGKNKIYVLGDSHSLFWSGFDVSCQIPFQHGIHIPKNHRNDIFKVFHLGPCLAYNMNRYGAKTQGLEKTEFLISENYIPHGATVMLVFGEIDIRVHVLKYGKQKMQLRIIEAINNYVSFIDKMAEKFNVICYGPIASQKDHWDSNPDYPRAGSERERNFATRILNDILSDTCCQRGHIFLSLFDELIDESFNTRENVIFDHCHLSPHLFPDACRKLFLLRQGIQRGQDATTDTEKSLPFS